jgi:PST family polysaccharide transporter
LITPLGSSIIPAMSRAESDAQWCTIYLRAITFAMVIAAPIAVAFTVFPHEIVSLLYGKGWGPSANLVAIFGPAMMIQPIYSSMGWLYISRGDARGMLRASIPASTVYLMAFLIGVQWGPEGLATGYVFASYIVIPVWIWWAVRRTPLSIRAVTTCVAGPMVSASAAGALIVVIGWSREDSFLFRISFFCALYGALIGILVLAIPSLRALVTRWVTDRRLLNPNSNG